MSKFVKEEVVTKRVLVEQVNASGPNNIYMSVKRGGHQSIKLVIGANYCDHGACYLSKDGLAELIEELKLIHEVL